MLLGMVSDVIERRQVDLSAFTNALMSKVKASWAKCEQGDPRVPQVEQHKHVVYHKWMGCQTKHATSPMLPEHEAAPVSAEECGKV